MFTLARLDKLSAMECLILAAKKRRPCAHVALGQRGRPGLSSAVKTGAHAFHPAWHCRRPALKLPSPGAPLLKLPSAPPLRAQTHAPRGQQAPRRAGATRNSCTLPLPASARLFGAALRGPKMNILVASAPKRCLGELLALESLGEPIADACDDHCVTVAAVPDGGAAGGAQPHARHTGSSTAKIKHTFCALQPYIRTRRHRERAHLSTSRPPLLLLPTLLAPHPPRMYHAHGGRAYRIRARSRSLSADCVHGAD